MVQKNGIYYLVREGKKPYNTASKKQWDFLMSFDNVSSEISVSQFMKYIKSDEASEAIELAKAGEKVIIE